MILGNHCVKYSVVQPARLQDVYRRRLHLPSLGQRSRLGHCVVIHGTRAGRSHLEVEQYARHLVAGMTSCVFHS